MAGQEEERDVESEVGRNSEEEEEEEEEEEKRGRVDHLREERENKYFILLKLYREATMLSTPRRQL